jgi:hypothetical protein
MAYPVPVPREFEAVLTTCSDEELQGLVSLAWEHPQIDGQTAHWVESVVRYELALRQQEPLWRKALRFYNRHHEAFAVAQAVILGFAGGFAGAAAYDQWDC